MFFLILLSYHLKLSDGLHDLVLSDEVLVLISRKFFGLYKYWQQQIFNCCLGIVDGMVSLICVCVHSRVCIKILSLQVKKKYNIDIEKLIVLSKRKASLLLTPQDWSKWILVLDCCCLIKQGQAI